MRLIELKEGSPKWLWWRLQGIGASDADVIMGTTKFSKTPLQLWGEKTGRKINEPANFQMRRGLNMEPEARDIYSQLTSVRMEKAFGEHDVFQFIRSSFDGISWDAGRVLEVKCPGEEDHAIAKSGRIPPHYLWQCVQLLLVSGMDSLDYFSYRPQDADRPTVIIPMKRDKALEKKLIASGIEFWNSVLQDRIPKPALNKVFEGGTFKERADAIFKNRKSR